MALTQITTGGLDDDINIGSNTLKVDGTNNKVGIGTASPSVPLHVYHATTNGVARFESGDATSLIQFKDSGTTLVPASVGAVGNDFVVQTNFTERMRIDSSGRLLVGTSSSLGGYASKLQVASTSDDQVTFARYTTASSPGVLALQRSGSGTIGTNAIVQNGDNLFSINFLGADGANYLNAASIIAAVDGTPGTNDMPGRLVFSTTADGASSPTERVRIDNSGKVKLTGGEALFWDDAGDRYIACVGDTSSNINLHGRANVIFQTGGSSYDGGTERMRIDSSGNVGIGTSSPSAKLDVAGEVQCTSLDVDGGANFYSTAEVVFDQPSSGNSANPAIQIKHDGTINASWRHDGRFELGGQDANANTTLYANGNANFGGNVLVGTTSLTYDDTGGTNVILEIDGGATAGKRGILSLSGRSGSNAADCGTIWFNNDNNSGTSPGSTMKLVAAIQAQSVTSDSNAGNDSGAYLQFITKPEAGSATERMRIASNGLHRMLSSGQPTLEVRNTSSSASSTLMQCAGGVTNMETGGSVVMKVLCDGDIENTNNRYTGISDIKLKENIVDANSQWDDIKALQVRNYNFKEELGYGTNTHIGLVAQEVEPICPGLVGETNDTDAENSETGTVTKSVAYSVLYMKAVKALQEAMDRIETLEAKVAALEAE